MGPLVDTGVSTSESLCLSSLRTERPTNRWISRSRESCPPPVRIQTQSQSSGLRIGRSRATTPEKLALRAHSSHRTRDWIYIMNTHTYICIISTTLQFPQHFNTLTKQYMNLNQTRTALLAGVLLLRLVGFVGLLLSESRASPVYSSRSKPNSSRILASGSFESTWGRSAGRWAGGQPVGGAFGVHFPPSYLATRHLDLALGPSVQPRPHHLVRERECLLA